MQQIRRYCIMAKTGKAPFCPWHLINDNPLISCLYCRPLGRCPICSSEATARQGEGTEGTEKKREKEREGERKLAYSASQTTGQFWTKICHCLYIGCAFFAGAALFDCRWHSHYPQLSVSAIRTVAVAVFWAHSYGEGKIVLCESSRWWTLQKISIHRHSFSCTLI